MPVRVMPPRDPHDGATALFRLQVTMRSMLGALAASCGAILVDNGWLRLLGSGLDALHQDMARQLADVPNGGRVMIRITNL